MAQQGSKPTGWRSRPITLSPHFAPPCIPTATFHATLQAYHTISYRSASLPHLTSLLSHFAPPPSPLQACHPIFALAYHPATLLRHLLSPYILVAPFRATPVGLTPCHPCDLAAPFRTTLHPCRPATPFYTSLTPWRPATLLGYFVPPTSLLHHFARPLQAYHPILCHPTTLRPCCTISYPPYIPQARHPVTPFCATLPPYKPYCSIFVLPYIPAAPFRATPAGTSLLHHFALPCYPATLQPCHPILLHPATLLPYYPCFGPPCHLHFGASCHSAALLPLFWATLPLYHMHFGGTLALCRPTTSILGHPASLSLYCPAAPFCATLKLPIMQKVTVKETLTMNA